MSRLVLPIVLASLVGLTRAMAGDGELQMTQLQRQQTKQHKIGGEIEFKQLVKAPAVSQNTRSCGADIAISYTQMDTVVAMESTIDNAECAASSGSLQVRLRTSNAHGVARTRTFTESWSRQSEVALRLEHNYQMAGDVDLLWIKVAAKTCSCVVDEAVPEA